MYPKCVKCPQREPKWPKCVWNVSKCIRKVPKCIQDCQIVSEKYQNVSKVAKLYQKLGLFCSMYFQSIFRKKKLNQKSDQAEKGQGNSAIVWAKKTCLLFPMTHKILGLKCQNELLWRGAEFITKNFDDSQMVMIKTHPTEKKAFGWIAIFIWITFKMESR